MYLVICDGCYLSPTCLEGAETAAGVLFACPVVPGLTEIQAGCGGMAHVSPVLLC